MKMTVNDLMKRLKKIDGNKMVLLVDSEGGWTNIELDEKKNDVHIVSDERNSPFDSDN